MIAPIRFDVAWMDGPDDTTRTVDGWTTLTPGIAVWHHIEKGTWNLTHLRSGALIGRADNPEQAQAIAAGLGWFDWTTSGADMVTEGRVRERVQLLVALGGRRARTYVVSEAVLER